MSDFKNDQNLFTTDGRPNSMHDDEGSDDGPVSCNFGFFDPTPGDSAGIAAYVPKYLNCERVELATIVARQALVGTTVKNATEDAEVGQSLFGFVSALNLGFYRDHACISHFVDWMMSLGNADLSELLTAHLNSTALFLNERAYGVPPELAPHLMRGVLKEIAWATEDAETPEERESFKITHFILVKKAIKTEDGLEFPLVEDEFFYNKAVIRHLFETGGEEGDLADCEYQRFVLVVTWDGAQEVRAQLNDMFGVDEATFAGEDAK